MAWLKALEIDQPALAIKRDILVDEIETFDRQIGRVEGELDRFARKSPAVALLRTIPGVGLRTAEAVAAFLDDPQRFANSKQVGAYFGLVPAQDQSADKNRLGHITREGSPVVRQYLTEAVWLASRLSPTIGAFRDRVQRGDPQRKKIAVDRRARGWPTSSCVGDPDRSEEGTRHRNPRKAASEKKQLSPDAWELLTFLLAHHRCQSDAPCSDPIPNQEVFLANIIAYLKPAKEKWNKTRVSRALKEVLQTVKAHGHKGPMAQYKQLCMDERICRELLFVAGEQIAPSLRREVQDENIERHSSRNY